LTALSNVLTMPKSSTISGERSSKCRCAQVTRPPLK
jgi:hypothetical protein